MQQNNEWLDWLRRDLDTLGRRLDRVDDKLDDVVKILASNTANLAEHMRRTDLLESRIQGAPFRWIKVTGVVIGIVGGIYTLLVRILQ